MADTPQTPATKPSPLMIGARIIQEIERHYKNKQERAYENAKTYALDALTTPKKEDREVKEFHARKYADEAKIWGEAFEMLREATRVGRGAGWGDPLEHLQKKYGKAPKISDFDTDIL